jgi:glycosyltransferase involved in cell wall biosynthesis
VPVFPDHTIASLSGRTILQIIPELETGGAERTTVDIAEALVAVGARALVATEGGRLVGELQAKGGEWLPFPAATKNPAAMVWNIGKLAGIIRKNKVDIVHARSRAPGWVALSAARRTRTPFVTTYHGSYSGTSATKVLYNSVMARGDVVIANSHYTADFIRTQHPWATQRIRVIPRGTDLSSFQTSAVDHLRVMRLREAWGVEPHQRIVLHPARLTRIKGQSVLLDAAAELKRQGLTDTIFVLAGDHQGRNAYLAELKSLVEQKGLSAEVRLPGHVADMAAAMLASGAVVLPSLVPETFGRVAAEAQAIGTPVIVSQIGALPETVLAPPDVPADQRTGWRVLPGDAMALAGALQEALSLRPSARDSLALRSRAHVEGHFSLAQMVEKTLDVYAALVERRGSV